MTDYYDKGARGRRADNTYHGLEINSYRFWTPSLISHASRGPAALTQNLTIERDWGTGAEKDILEETTASGTTTAHKPFVIKQKQLLPLWFIAPAS